MCSTSCLQVLDDGRLSDNQGHTVDFTNTIVVMTSNIGSQAIQEISREGGSEQEIREAVMSTLQTRFLPEFLNRIDETIIFHPLDRQQLHHIVELQIERLRKQLEQNDLELEVTAAAVDADRARRLRPDIRRPTAEARGSATDSEPAGFRAVEGAVPAA